MEEIKIDSSLIKPFSELQRLARLQNMEIKEISVPGRHGGLVMGIKISSDKKKNEIIDDFIYHSSERIGNMKRMLGGDNMCPICGLTPKHIELLSEAVKELRDKQ